MLAFRIAHVEDIPPCNLMHHEQPIGGCVDCEEPIFASELTLDNRCPNCGSKFIELEGDDDV